MPSIESEYGKVILPFTVLRRLDCVLENTKPAVLSELATRKKTGLNPEPFLLRKSGQLFFNTSRLDLKKLLAIRITSSKGALHSTCDEWSDAPRSPRADYV